MVISSPCFLKNFSPSPNITNLRYTNIVYSQEEAEYIVYDNYKIEDVLHDEEELKSFFEKNKTKKLLIDNSTELTSSVTTNILLKLPFQKNVVLLTNGAGDDWGDIQLKHSKVNYIVKDFFVEYMHYYSPDFTYTGVTPVKNKVFTLLTGKPKIERSLLLKNLYDNNILKNGYVSYFGIGSENQNFLNSTNPSGHLFRQEYVEDINIFHKKLKDNLYVDTSNFNYDISHTRHFRASPYMYSEFIVVCESDLYHPRFFHTEKSIKPIILNKKFILLNNQGSLADLKYKMLKYHRRDISDLTDWVDTSYDSISDLEERIYVISNLIIDNVKKHLKKVETII